MTAREHNRPRALYVHVPFCIAKCAYCDFYSVARNTAGVRKFLDALPKELALTAHERREPFTTVFIGGGTPTVLDPGELDAMLAMLREAAPFAEGAEFTVEANPGTITREKLRVLRERGVNRLSIGAQSFDDRLLKVLGRRHTRRDVFDALAAAREEGFANLSLDVIFGIPSETVDDWKRDLAELSACRAPHVSAYSLTWEHGTPLTRALEAGQVDRVGEEDELAMYECAIDTLGANGYEHYEISNFARSGFHCRHNEVYWANESYLGVGPSAVSYVDGERRRNVGDVDAWAEMLREGKLPVDFREHLDDDRRARETAVMNLRRTRGIDFAEFRAHTGFDAPSLFEREFRELSADGLLEVSAGAAKLTRRGLVVADSVLSELV